jgi:hypothetical protein
MGDVRTGLLAIPKVFECGETGLARSYGATAVEQERKPNEQRDENAQQNPHGEASFGLE